MNSVDSLPGIEVFDAAVIEMIVVVVADDDGVDPRQLVHREGRVPVPLRSKQLRRRAPRAEDRV